MRRFLRRYCCVPTCRRGSKSENKKNSAEGKRNPSLFSFPKDPELRRKWITKIKRLDREPTTNDRVCEVHFQSEFIVRFYETNMPDGTVNRIGRGIPTITPDAIPTIFPNRPRYMTTSIKTRKPPKERKPIINVKKRPTQQTLEPATKHPCEDAPPEIDDFNNTNVPPVPVPMSVADNEQVTTPPCEIDPLEIVPDGSLSFNTFHSYVNNGLICMLAKLKVPDGWWKAVLPDMCVIMWIDKNDNYNVTKRVLIDSTGNVKVYIGLVRVTVEGYEVLSTSKGVLTLLDIIKPMLVCPGAFDRHSGARFSCRGYHFKGARCIACSTNQSRKGKKQQPKQKTMELKTEALLTEALVAIERADEVLRVSNKKNT